MTTHRAALTVAHIAAVLFGLTGIFGALIKGDAAFVTFGRAAFAVVALALFAATQKRPLLRSLNRQGLRILALTGLLLTAHWVTFFVAVKTGGVAVATLGFASFPLFIALLDILVFSERIGMYEGALLTLVTIGLVLITPSFDFGDRGTIGLLWGLASGLSFAVLAMANRRGARGMDAMQVAFWQNVVVALLVAPFAVGNLGKATSMDWFYLSLLGVFCTGLSQYLFVKSLGGLSARSAGVIIALEPVYAIACAWWLFSEQPSLRMFAGTALIVFATVVSARGRRPAEHDANAPCPATS
jgi:drug/metabolite transporter (DMT)-like permease